MVKIAIASCARRQLVPDQPAWREIADEDPDALLLLGDNMYLDREDDTIGKPPSASLAQRKKDAKKLAKQLTARYVDQFSEPNFRQLMIAMGLLGANGKRHADEELKASPSKVFPIYDDHDFLGNNRCGADPGNKELRAAARDTFITTFGRRRWSGVGLFSVTRNVGGLVDIFVLDGRYYRKSDAIQPNNADSMLGTTQWTWLERKLAEPTEALYTVLMSGTTVHDYGVENQESWQGLYPDAYERLAKNLKDRPGALVVSGDIHTNARKSEGGIVEIVSSGVATRQHNTLIGDERGNYGILTFDELGVQVSLRGLSSERNFSFPLAEWGTEEGPADPADQELPVTELPESPPDFVDLRGVEQAPANI